MKTNNFGNSLRLLLNGALEYSLWTNLTGSLSRKLEDSLRSDLRDGPELSVGLSDSLWVSLDGNQNPRFWTALGYRFVE